MDTGLNLILASASPRRQELLHQIGVNFTQCPVDICEAPLRHELPLDYVERLAKEKARRALSLGGDNIVVLGADTTVLHNGCMMGKPDNKEHAQQMLMTLSNSCHTVLTAVAMLNNRHAEFRVSETNVYFRCLSKLEISRYWETGEPQDKAGGYAIQGKGAVFVDKIEGSYSGVVGLPLRETCELLEAFNLPWWCK